MSAVWALRVAATMWSAGDPMRAQRWTGLAFLLHEQLLTERSFNDEDP